MSNKERERERERERELKRLTDKSTKGMNNRSNVAKNLRETCNYQTAVRFRVDRRKEVALISSSPFTSLGSSGFFVGSEVSVD